VRQVGHAAAMTASARAELHVAYAEHLKKGLGQQGFDAAVISYLTPPLRGSRTDQRVNLAGEDVKGDELLALDRLSQTIDDVEPVET